MLILNSFSGEESTQTPATKSGLVGRSSSRESSLSLVSSFLSSAYLTSACALRSLQKLPTAPLHQQHTRYSCKETSWLSRYVHPHAQREMVGSRLLGPPAVVSCTNVDPAELCQALGSGSVDGAVSVSLFPALPPAPEHISDSGFPSERSWLLAAAAADHRAPGQHQVVLRLLMGQQQTATSHPVRAAGVSAQRQCRATVALGFSRPSNLRAVSGGRAQSMGRDPRQRRRDPQVGHGSQGHPKQQI